MSELEPLTTSDSVSPYMAEASAHAMRKMGSCLRTPGASGTCYRIRRIAFASTYSAIAAPTPSLIATVLG